MGRFNLILILLFSSFLYGKDLKPTYIYQANGGVTDIIFNQNKLFVATDASGVDIFDFKTKKLIKTIKVPQITDFMGDIIDAKIYNIDSYKDKILLTAQAKKGFREIYIVENGKTDKVITIDNKMFISKAKFINDNEILFSLLGNEMYLFNFKTKKIIWKIDVKEEGAEFNSTFADFTLNEDKTIAVVADESGDLKIIDIKKGQVIGSRERADRHTDPNRPGQTYILTRSRAVRPSK